MILDSPRVVLSVRGQITESPRIFLADPLAGKISDSPSVVFAVCGQIADSPRILLVDPGDILDSSRLLVL